MKDASSARRRHTHSESIAPGCKISFSRDVYKLLYTLSDPENTFKQNTFIHHFLITPERLREVCERRNRVPRDHKNTQLTLTGRNPQRNQKHEQDVSLGCNILTADKTADLTRLTSFKQNQYTRKEKNKQTRQKQPVRFPFLIFRKRIFPHGDDFYHLGKFQNERASARWNGHEVPLFVSLFLMRFG